MAPSEDVRGCLSMMLLGWEAVSFDAPQPMCDVAKVKLLEWL